MINDKIANHSLAMYNQISVFTTACNDARGKAAGFVIYTPRLKLTVDECYQFTSIKYHCIHVM